MFKIKYRLFLVCMGLAFLAPMQADEVLCNTWKHAYREDCYAELKNAVCVKMGPNFTADFNKAYPESSREAVQYLALYVDAVTRVLQESYPPQMLDMATIGSKHIVLQGDIASIIFDIYYGSKRGIAISQEESIDPIDQKYELCWSYMQKIAISEVEEFNVHLLPSIKELEDDDVLQELMNYCLYHLSILDIAFELHANPKLYDLVVRMQQEVTTSSAASPFITSFFVDLGIWLDWLRLDLIRLQDSFDEILYARAVVIELIRRNHTDITWDHILALKEIMDGGTDKQVSTYLASEKKRLNDIHQILHSSRHSF